MSQGSPTEEFGPYLVYEQLGVGGMAQVHRAISANADFPGPVALKRMLAHIASSEDMVKSFVREARLASYLRHKNVAQTYDLGRVGDVYFIVMELITGRNLREVLRHCGPTTGPMPVPIALNILNQVCDALDYAHNLCDEAGEPLGIVHRDVSPSNVIVSDEGIVKLIDFGIAKGSAAGMQTMSGTLKGKFAYMAPEYIAGRLDARADLFALGVIAHELLTNLPLFAGRDDIDTLTRVRDMHIEPPSAKNPLVPPEIDDIVMTALARDPERRWQHATALRSALTTLTERLGLVATNQRVVEWLDWAFAQPRMSRAIATETDAELISEPSISVESFTDERAPSGPERSDEHEPSSLRTDERAPSSIERTDEREPHTQITLVPEQRIPAPPSITPVGTPAYMPLRRSARHRAAPIAPPRSTADGSRRHGRRATTSDVRPPTAWASTSHPVRRPAASTPPPVAPGIAQPPAQVIPAASTTLPGTCAPAHAAPPSAAAPVAIAPPLSGVVTLPPAVPFMPPLAVARVAIGSRAVPVLIPAPLPPVPIFNPAPFAAPRPSTLSMRLPCDPVRSEVVKRDFEQRVSAPWGAATARPSGRPRPIWAFVLVALAAVIAALIIYFVLPLLI